MAARKTSEELLHRSEQATMVVQNRQWQEVLRDMHGLRVYCGGRAKRTFPWKDALASGRFPRTQCMMLGSSLHLPGPWFPDKSS